MNWIPVTITEQGTSNGARITGYKVYINGVPCAEVTSPTADSVSVVSWMIERAAKKSRSHVLSLVVRTQSLDGESADSNLVEIPLDTFNFKGSQLIKAKGIDPTPPKKESHKTQDQRVTVMVNGYEILQPENEDHLESVADKEQPTNAGPTSVDSAPDFQDRASLVESRTKGEPVVWRLDETETGDSTRSESNESSNDEEEQVEICTPLPLEGKARGEAEDSKRKEEMSYERLVEVRFVCLSACLSVCLLLFVCLPFVCLSVCLSVCLVVSQNSCVGCTYCQFLISKYKLDCVCNGKSPLLGSEPLAEATGLKHYSFGMVVLGPFIWTMMFYAHYKYTVC